MQVTKHPPDFKTKKKSETILTLECACSSNSRAQKNSSNVNRHDGKKLVLPENDICKQFYIKLTLNKNTIYRYKLIKIMLKFLHRVDKISKNS